MVSFKIEAMIHWHSSFGLVSLWQRQANQSTCYKAMLKMSSYGHDSLKLSYTPKNPRMGKSRSRGLRWSSLTLHICGSGKMLIASIRRWPTLGSQVKELDTGSVEFLSVAAVSSFSNSSDSLTYLGLALQSSK